MTRIHYTFRKELKIGLCFLLLPFVSYTFNSCADDEGNYDYTDVNQLTISGIQDSYEVEQFSELIITPNITGSKSFNESDYSYTWFIYKTNSKEVPDTVSHEKNLNISVAKAPSSSYRLMFEVRENETGRVTYHRSDMSVINTYSKGLAVLSEVEGMAKVAFINSLDHVTEDAYGAVNGRPAGRGPIGIFLVGRNSNSDQFIVISTEDSVMCCNNIDFSYVMNFQEMFYFPSSPGRLENVLHGRYPYYEYVIVDGCVYKRDMYVGSGATSTLPKFPAKLASQGKVSKYGFFNDNSQGYFYNTDKKCFVYDTYNDIGFLSSGYGNEYWDACNVGMDMIWGGCALNDDNKTFIRTIMQDSNGKRYLLWGIKGNDYDPSTWDSWYYLIPSGKREITGDMAKTNVFTFSSLDVNYLYYGYGNKITCVSVVTGNVISETTVDGGNIDYMEFDPADNTKLYVGASDGSSRAKSGSVYVMQMTTNGQLTMQKSYKNISGKVVDFETNTSDR